MHASALEAPYRDIALRELLIELLSVGKLKRLLWELPGGKYLTGAQVAGMLSPSAPPFASMNTVMTLLKANGQVVPFLDILLRRYPHRREQIEQVRVLWTTEPSTPTSAPRHRPQPVPPRKLLEAMASMPPEQLLRVSRVLNMDADSVQVESMSASSFQQADELLRIVQRQGRVDELVAIIDRIDPERLS